jgi:hypothetical protein
MRLRFRSPNEASRAVGLLVRKQVAFQRRFRALPSIAICLVLIVSASAWAQDNASDPPAASSSAPQALPGAPEPQNGSPDEPAQQTKRILGIIPNFRSVNTDEKLPPQTVKDKFVDATQDSFDYSSVFIPAVLAAQSMSSRAYPEFGDGAAAYGRYFWRSALDQTDENYMVEFVFPVLTREDTRYYTLGRGGFLRRTGYALSRAVVTRTDAGNESFNISEVVGAGAASGVSGLYYPSRERSLSNTANEWAVDIGIDALSFVGREFWPDINRKLFHGRD